MGLFCLLYGAGELHAFDEYKCMMQRLREQSKDYSELQGLAEKVEQLLQDKNAVKQADMARNISNNLRDPQYPMPLYEIRKKDAKGKDYKEFWFGEEGENNTAQWLDQEKLDKLIPEAKIKSKKIAYVRGFCQRQFGDDPSQNSQIHDSLPDNPQTPAEMCATSFFAKEKVAEQFVMANEDLIMKLADKLKDNRSQKPSEMIQASQLKFEGEKWANELNGATLIGHFVRLVDHNSQRYLPNIIQDEKNKTLKANVVFDKNGNVLGKMLPVERGGKVESFFAPQEGPGQYLNPYFFVFGGIPADTWNRYWERKIPNLKIDEQS